MEGQDIPYVHSIATRLRGRSLQGWNKNDFIVVVICVLLCTCVGVWLAGLAGSSYVGTLGAVVTAILLWFWLLHRYNDAYGRGYRQIGLYLRSNTKRPHWQQGRKPRIPLDLQFVVGQDASGDSRKIALLHNREAKLDRMYIRARGGLFAAEDAQGQHRLAEELSQILDRAFNMSDLSAGVAFLHLSSPASMASMDAYICEHGDPAVFLEGVFQLEPDQEEFAQFLREIQDEIYPALRELGAADDWGLIAVTIKRRKRQWRKVLQGQATKDEIYELPVFELGLGLVEALESSSLGLSDIHVLEPHELFLLCRASWDVYGMAEWQDTYWDIVQRYGDSDDLMTQLVSHLSCWPEEIIQSETDTVVRWDDNYLQVLRVNQVPELLRADVCLGLQYGIAAGGKWVRRFYGGESISGDTETTTTLVGSGLLINFETAFLSNMTVRHPALARRERKLAERADMTSTMAKMQLSNEYVVVVGPDVVTVRKHAKAVKAEYLSANYRVDVVEPSALHIDAVLAALAAPNL